MSEELKAVVANSKDIPSKIQTLLTLMEEAEAIVSSLSGEELEAINDFHAEDYSLNYCTRWGLQAAEELSEFIQEVKKN